VEDHQNKLPDEGGELPTRVEPYKPEVLTEIPNGPIEQAPTVLNAPAPALPPTDQPNDTAMEVHHHAHAPHGKNKWKEYLFQFFMLFLAVFCGFLAEYQLEHVIEHQREKQFMESLINDVNADINRLSTIIELRTAREKRLDSLSLLMNDDFLEGATNNIYANAITAARSLWTRFIPNDGTLQQLKNSGAFRLIRNRAVADSISRYDVTVRSYLRQGEIEETSMQDFRIASAAIFDGRVFDRMLDGDNNVRSITENPPLLNYDMQDLTTWNYRMYSLKAINKAIRRDARLLLRQAKNLSQTLKKAYHLK
jgi:hypothetical protein